MTARVKRRSRELAVPSPHGSQCFGSYPKYRDSGIEWLEEIPAHWEVRRLKECASAWLSNVDKKSVEGEPEVRLCNYVDVYYHDRIHGEMEFMTATATPAQVRKFSLREGDVLITKDSETWTDIAVPALVTEDLADVVCGYHLALIRPKRNCVGGFVGRAIGAVGLREQYRVAANGITRFGLTADGIRNSVLPLPPLSEQLSIARFLAHETAKVGGLVAKQQELIGLLQEKRTALISHAVTRGLDPDAAMRDSGVEWLGEIPAHWDMRRLRHVASKFGSGVTPRGGAAVYQAYGIPFLRSQNVHFNGIRMGEVARIPPDLHAALSGTHVRSGDVLLNITGASIGRVCAVPVGFGTANINQHVCIIRPKRARLLAGFLAALLGTPGMQAAIMLAQSGAAREGLTLASIRHFPVPLPSLTEQQSIADHLDRETAKIDASVAKITDSIAHLNEYRTALIAAAVTGKIDVRRALEPKASANPTTP